MDKVKEGTRALLGESLKGLMIKGLPFEKITIKDITDGAGVIRPTFYNHFQDKYELLEWIFYREVIVPTYALVRNQLMPEAVRLIFSSIHKDGAFYRQAVRVSGQNGFGEMLERCAQRWILTIIEEQGFEGSPEGAWLNPQNVSRYYANCMTFIIINWIEAGFAPSVDEMLRLYHYVSTHTVEETLKGMT